MYQYLINWVGGKRLLRKHIAKLIPTDINGYIEPFGGGAWVLFYKEKWAPLEVYNDLDDRLSNLFNVVKYHPCELARQMCYMLSSRTQFRQQMNLEPITDIQKAARFLYITTHSFGARGESFATSKTAAMKSAYGIIERVQTIAKRLDKVIIENKNAINIIKSYDSKENFFYCDPPYTTGAGYAVTTCKDFDHTGLFNTLKNIKGRFLLSYNDCENVRKLYKSFNIIEVSRQKGINNKQNGKENVFKELLIMNY